MTRLQSKLVPWLAKFASIALCAVLFLCANTNSSCLIHQPETPKGLDKFSKIK